MGRRHAIFVALAAALILMPTPRIHAQATVTREQLHPELVDTTWGRRVQDAWQRAFALDWTDARTRFQRLHDDQPRAIEPLIGLGFVARATGRGAEARRYFHDALTLDPTSADARAQLDASEWDRPGSVDIAGGASRLGSVTRQTLSVAAVVPLARALTVTAGGGVFGGGDPLRGIFLDSTNAGARTTVVSAGAVVKPVDRVALTLRGERWSAPGTTDDFLWTEASMRFTAAVAARGGVRWLSGERGAPKIMIGTDLVPVEHSLISVDVSQGTHAAPFEARTIVRGFATATPSPRSLFRLVLVRDVDPRLSATTAGASAGWFATPTAGLRLDGSKRVGAFPQTSASLSLLLRW